VTCERCKRRPAVVAVVDAPGFLWDEVLGRVLCGPCLDATEADGPWDEVHELVEAVAA